MSRGHPASGVSEGLRTLMEKLWTTAEAAQYLGIMEADVEELVRQGKLTGYKLGGQFTRFRPDQVQALKGMAKLRSSTGRPAPARKDPLGNHIKDFLYFYDFYLASAFFLAALIVYLIAAG